MRRYPPGDSFSNGNDRASQVPGEPLCTCPVLKTPAGPSRQADCGVSIRPSAFRTASAPATRFFRGSMARPAHPLSTLRRADYSATTQDSLPAAGQALPDRMLPPAGFQRKVSTMSHNIASPFPKLSLTQAKRSQLSALALSKTRFFSKKRTQSNPRRTHRPCVVFTPARAGKQWSSGPPGSGKK